MVARQASSPNFFVSPPSSHRSNKLARACPRHFLSHHFLGLLTLSDPPKMSCEPCPSKITQQAKDTAQQVSSFSVSTFRCPLAASTYSASRHAPRMRDKWLHVASLAALTIVGCAFFFGVMHCLLPVDDEENQQSVVCNKQVISSCAGGLSAFLIGLIKELGDFYNVWPQCRQSGCTPSGGDVMANLLGVVLGELMIALLFWVYSKKKSR